jgi:RNA polymerase sigma factor (TIGR02999 family)
MPKAMSDVTQILNAVEVGDTDAMDQLLPLVYDELRQLGAAQMGREKPGHTLDATALVHEAYIRLVASPVASAPGNARGADATPLANRRYFFAAAAEAMRRILVENGRPKRSLKRGGDLVRSAIDSVEIPAPDESQFHLDLDDTLSRPAVERNCRGRPATSSHEMCRDPERCCSWRCST